MKLEELIQKRFVSTAALAERLTTYNGVPAVFSPEAPGDEQEGWGGETQYPMVTYNYDLQANEERNSAGSLSVSIFCQNTADTFPEDIAPSFLMDTTLMSVNWEICYQAERSRESGLLKHFT